MADLSLMASATFSPVSFHQDPGLCRLPLEEFRLRLPGHDRRQEMLKSGSLQLSIQHFDHSWQSMSLLSDYHTTAKPAPPVQKPMLIDVHDVRPDSVLFSIGIAEQCTRHEKILNFLMSGLNIEGEGLDISILTDLMGLRTVAVDMRLQPHTLRDDTFGLYDTGMDDSHHFMGLHTVAPQPHVLRDDNFGLYDTGMDDSQHFMHPESQFFCPKSVLELVGSHSSMIMVHPDERVLFTGSRAEMKDLLSFVAEFYPSNRWSNGSRQMVVPYFNWSGGGRRRAQGYSSKLQTRTVSHLNSLENVKLKPQSKKKQNRMAENQRDLFRKNYFHACESLLYAILNKRDRMAILSLTKSGPEVTRLLTEFSTGIAGTGLAVLFAVVYKVPSGKVTFSAAKLLNTGFGFGLFWLSSAVNRLRVTISYTSKNSSQLKLREEEIVEKVERSVNEVLFRAMALIVVAVLRFA